MIHPMEVVMIKMMEADQIKVQFDFDELEVSAAISSYGLEANPQLEPIRTRMDQVTKKLLLAEQLYREHVRTRIQQEAAAGNK